MLNQNSPAYKSHSIKSLEALGLTNYMKAQPLCIQKRALVEQGIRAGKLSATDFN